MKKYLAVRQDNPSRPRRERFLLRVMCVTIINDQYLLIVYTPAEKKSTYMLTFVNMLPQSYEENLRGGLSPAILRSRRDALDLLLEMPQHFEHKK